jgi:hypothetical protein
MSRSNKRCEVANRKYAHPKYSGVGLPILTNPQTLSRTITTLKKRFASTMGSIGNVAIIRVLIFADLERLPEERLSQGVFNCILTDTGFWIIRGDKQGDD